MIEPPEPTRRVEPSWLDPYPDVLLERVADTAPGPEARYETRESVGLAFVAALQHLPPRQRVRSCCATCSAFTPLRSRRCSTSSEASVKGALQRARATLDARMPARGRELRALTESARERELLGRFAAAVERGDTDGVVSLLTDDAWVTMPPEPYEYQGSGRSRDS